MNQPFTTSQIDGLGDRLRIALTDADIHLLDAYRRTFATQYDVVVGTIRDQLRLEPTGRPAKSTSAIVDKLRRETIRLSQMQDIAGCRLVVAGVMDQDRVVAEVQGCLADSKVVDRRSHPSFGYRAVHVIAAPSGKSVEVQIRTALQHLWAEVSEKLSDVVDPTVKYGGGVPKLRDLLRGASDLVSSFEDAERLRAKSTAKLSMMSSLISQLESRRELALLLPPTPESAGLLSRSADGLKNAKDRLAESRRADDENENKLVQLGRSVAGVLQQIRDSAAELRSEFDDLPDSI